MSVSKWKCSHPKKNFRDFVQQFGKPTFVANVPNGMVLWKTRGLFVEHILRDEQIKHCAPPKSHNDYFYSTIKLYIPPNLLTTVLAISSSIHYDSLKHHLTARCDNFNANTNSLYRSAKVAMGEYTRTQIRSKILGPKMKKGPADYTFMLKELNRLKKANHKKYHKQLTLPYYPLSFSKC